MSKERYYRGVKRPVEDEVISRDRGSAMENFQYFFEQLSLGKLFVLSKRLEGRNMNEIAKLNGQEPSQLNSLWTEIRREAMFVWGTKEIKERRLR